MKPLFFMLCLSTDAFMILPSETNFANVHRQPTVPRIVLFDNDQGVDVQSEGIPFDSLVDMDVVIYKENEGTDFLLGALQEDGSLAPLSAWSDEPAFGESIELLVDEDERFSLDVNRVDLYTLVPEENLSYGSRQCHRGVGNPHGEESELLYYVDQSIIDKFEIKLDLKPDLEILW